MIGQYLAVAGLFLVGSVAVCYLIDLIFDVLMGRHK